jgi:hypothetical protein
MPHDEKTIRRRRRAEDTRRWRDRKKRGVELFQVEIGPDEYDLAVRFAKLQENQITNKKAVNIAIARLLRRALGALMRENNHRQ